FQDVLWPDFDRRDLWRACLEYAQRDRRFGGAVEEPQPSVPPQQG
ncbi:undecaprenyl diphosphate synthase family protein, partial [Streptomyces sampsonii]